MTVDDRPDGTAARLRRERNVWLTTLRPDGSPHVTPVWFVWHEGAFWCCVTGTSVKRRNLDADPRVALALEDGDRPVVAEGTAVLHARPYPEAVVDAFLSTFDWDITRPDDEGDWDTLLQITPARWLLGDPPR